MDEMKIKSKMLTGLISKIIAKNVKKKIGTSCNVSIEEITFKNDGTMTTVKLNIEAGVETSQIPEILKKLEIM